MANYDYEIVNGRKIRVRPKETVSEIDKNGYFRRQPNHFTTLRGQLPPMAQKRRAGAVSGGAAGRD